MRLTIIPSDSMVIVDGRAAKVSDLSFLDPDIRAVQWDGTQGHLEWLVDGRYFNTDLADIADYQPAIVAWQAIVDAEDNPPPPDPNAVPPQVSPYQARIALLQAGYLASVEALMADPNTPAAAKIAWEYATVWERQSAFIETLGPALGLSSEQIDDLFRAAAQVV